MTQSKLLIVSNRLPVTIEKDVENIRLRRSSGGLVTALHPVLQQHSGSWIGWTGTDRDPDVEQALIKSNERYGLVPVFLNAEERLHFYCGFCNEILWPLFHDLQSRCNFLPEYWTAYLEVNRKFAQHTLRASSDPRQLVWVQDYHLMLVGEMLRQAQYSHRLAYFHHIPFPPKDIFEKLPWRKELLSGLLAYDLIGFQTARDRQNFIACVRNFMPKVRLHSGGEHIAIESQGRSTTAGTFPIGIDFAEFAECAAGERVSTRTREIRSSLNVEHVLLGVDRLDYTKGIPERLKAYRRLLEMDAATHQRLTLLQVVVPSRQDIPKYHELKLEIEQLTSEINGQFGVPGWVPVQYIHRQLDREELVAYYRAADIALVTPLKDGMNLVCKEYCAAKVDSAGVLILSEFAGAAPQLRAGAVLVNPYDTNAVAAAIQRALLMSPLERRLRMGLLRRSIEQQNVYAWYDDFIAQAGASGERFRRMGAKVLPRRASAG